MPIMIGKGGIFLNNRRLLEGEYHIVRGAGIDQPPTWSGYIEIMGHSRDRMAEIFNWFDAQPTGLVFAAANGGTLPVSHLKREQYDFETGVARFKIVFATAKEM